MVELRQANIHWHWQTTITGAMSGNADYCYGVLNPGTITVDGCTMEISGGVNGITSGRWEVQ